MRFTLLILMMMLATSSAAMAREWDGITSQSKPWTRWWWLGSAVDKPNITRLLEQYQKAGFGGVEICPIYGAKGFEGEFIDFLSPKWMEMLAHTTSEAKRLGMQVDLTTGTGWPFGGPWVSERDASAKIVIKGYDVPTGEAFNEYTGGYPQAIEAFSEDGQHVSLRQTQSWTAPAGKWRVYTGLLEAPIQKVKRAAPGGAGNVLDPYSVTAMEKYLSAFDKAFEGFSAPMPRSQFHDSFEYFQANWTDDFMKEFQKRRGYDLKTQFKALAGDGPTETVSRVKHDYRETLFELHLDYVNRWIKWSHDRGSLSRNQAHGAPGNLIDLYAAADIPETEIFGSVEEKHIPMHKLSSSAAHLTGRQLASSESFTWLGEHFQVSLADVKPACDFLFLSGVNHLFFHGVPYSPEKVDWPGWLFYASVHFGPNGGLWHDLPAFNAYIARCQSILQAGRSDNDVLLYWPIHDSWQSDGNLLMQMTVHAQDRWLHTTGFFKTAMQLWEGGYAFDEISDRLLAGAKVENGQIALGGKSYRVLIIPSCKLMPVETMKKLSELAGAGATVIVQDALPTDVPGFADLENRRAQLKAIGTSALKVGAKLEPMLESAKVPREAMVESGLRFVRRTRDQGRDYFIVNRGDKAVDQAILLGTPSAAAIILDPMGSDRVAMVPTPGGKIYLQLQPGESRIVRTIRPDAAPAGEKPPETDPGTYVQRGGEGTVIAGTWKVHFLEGGPALPKDFQADTLASWTAQDDPEAKRFAGTASYTIEFDKPASQADDWLLDLGKVCDSARVTLNGKEIAAVWCKPFELRVGPHLTDGKNTLQLDVTNVAANRIADMDRRGVKWKSFHEINFVNKAYKPFDASTWPVRDSGLLGPVKLVPLKNLDPNAVK